MINKGFLLGAVPKVVIELPKEEGAKNRKIAQILKDMTLKARESRVVRQFAINLLQTSRVRPKDYMGEIKTLYEFVRDKIPYRRDASFLDTFTEPEQQIIDFLYGNPSGDCDDKATLLASMLLTIGHVPRFALANNRPGGSYTHIYVEVQHPTEGYWIALETTEPVEMGWAPPTFKKGIITLINQKE